MKRILRSAVSLLLCAAVALGGTACGRSKLPTTITIWTYYNGDQLDHAEYCRNCLRNHGRVCNSGNAHVELGNEYNI